MLLPSIYVSQTSHRFSSRVFLCRYSVSRQVETHMSGSSKNLASHAKVSVLLILPLVKFVTSAAVCAIFSFACLLSQVNNNYLFGLHLQDNFRGTCLLVPL